MIIIKKLSVLAVLILLPLLTGFVSGQIAGNTSEVLMQLNRPAISPPGYVFPIVWTILYILMGIASYFIYTSDDESSQFAFKVYIFQLVLNFFWSIIFFRWGLINFAFVWLILLTATVAYMIYLFYKIDKRAAYLLIQYLLWCLFATYLNLQFVLLN